MADEPGQYCGCHPGTKREKNVVVSKPGEPIMTMNEGMTISGVYCPHRRLTKYYGWQSYCTRFIRLSKGCEK